MKKCTYILVIPSVFFNTSRRKMGIDIECGWFHLQILQKAFGIMRVHTKCSCLGMTAFSLAIWMEEKRLKTSDYLRDISTRRDQMLTWSAVRRSKYESRVYASVKGRLDHCLIGCSGGKENAWWEGALAWLSMPVVSCKNVKNEHCLRTPESTYLLMTAAYGLCALVDGLLKSSIEAAFKLPFCLLALLLVS